VPRKRPTLDDVATVAGVSKTAVSRVINDAPGASPETREHVRRVIARLGYRPDPVAQALAHGRGDVVDLVVIDDIATWGSNPHYGRVVAGIVQETADTDVRLRVHVVADPEAPALLSRIAGLKNLGILLVNVIPPLASELHARNGRVVSMGASARDVPSVEPENGLGAQTAVWHLYETGRRRIGAIHGPAGNSCAVTRRAGYRHAVRAAGLPEIMVDGDFGRRTGYARTLRLLTEHPDLDALFVAGDLMAAGALQALADQGRRVPADVAVVSFDDSVIATSTTPALSSVHQPVEEMAAAVVRTLMQRSPSGNGTALFATQLRIRRSSGA
jgi:DNA-binding LacI/PurR family transcriptional regulator